MLEPTTCRGVPRIGSTPSPQPFRACSASYGPWRLEPRRVRGRPQSRFSYLKPRRARFRECSTRCLGTGVIAPFGAVRPMGAGGHHCTPPIRRFRAFRGPVAAERLSRGQPTYARFLFHGFARSVALRKLVRSSPRRHVPYLKVRALGFFTAGP